MTRSIGMITKELWELQDRVWEDLCTASDELESDDLSVERVSDLLAALAERVAQASVEARTIIREDQQ